MLHFSGHRADTGDLVFQADDGGAKLVPKEAIVATIATAAEGVRLILFNSCHSTDQAQGVVQHVEVAIGMDNEIGDDAARIFSSRFYSAVGFGKSVQTAFDQGVAALKLDGVPENSTPNCLPGRVSTQCDDSGKATSIPLRGLQCSWALNGLLKPSRYREGGRVATAEDFTRRQQLASARIVKGLGGIRAAKENFTERVMRSVAAVVNSSENKAGRAGEAVRLVGPSIEAIELSLEEETPEIMAAVAELSENWEEHRRLWDTLAPSDMPVVLEAEESVTELRDALADARESDGTFVESLQNFAAIGPGPTAVAMGTISRLQGVMAVLDE